MKARQDFVAGLHYASNLKYVIKRCCLYTALNGMMIDKAKL